MKLTVIGAGAWGTAIAVQAAQHLPAEAVGLWTRSAAQARTMQQLQENSTHLPGVVLPRSILIFDHFAQAMQRIGPEDLIVIATPISGLVETVRRIAENASGPLQIVWLCKGLEAQTALLPHQLVARELALHARGIKHTFGALTGPSFAREMALGLPCALTIASASETLCTSVQKALHHDNLRIYASDDLIGVELGGAVKNVIAIAAGIGDGLGLGLNARAALLTRGLAEMMRLVKAAGGRPETCMGLTGVGDLILTATGDLSRNRRVGLLLAEGKPLSIILSELGHVAEGVLCAQALLTLANRLAVEMPITTTVSEVLLGKQTLTVALQGLMGRDAKSES